MAAIIGEHDKESCQELPPSILMLDNSSLCMILSYLDPEGFFNLLQTCTFLKEMCMSNYLQNSRVVRRKAISLVLNSTRARSKNEDMENLFTEGIGLGKSCQRFRLQQMKKVWESCGPVLATIASYMVHSKESAMDGEPRETCRTRFYEYEFLFPSERRVTLHISKFWDAKMNYDNQQIIGYTLDGYKNNVRYNSSPGGPIDWYRNNDNGLEDSSEISCLENLSKVFNDELGKLVEPITPYVFEEFHDYACAFNSEQPRLYDFDPMLPNKFVENDKNDFNEKIMLKHLSRNKRHAVDAFTTKLNPCIQKEQHDLVSLVTSVASKGNVKELREWDRAREIAIGVFYEQKSLINPLITLSLLKRLDFSSYSGEWGAGAICDKFVSTKYLFHCSGGTVVAVEGTSYCDGNSYPDYSDQTFTFHMEGEKIELSEKEMSCFNESHLRKLSTILEKVKETVEADLIRIGTADLTTEVTCWKVLLFFVNALWKVRQAFYRLAENLDEIISSDD